MIFISLCVERVLKIASQSLKQRRKKQMRTLTPLCWLQSDLEDQANELRSVEENSKKACADAARLAEELRQEQDHAGHIEKMRRTLESQVKELQVGDGPPHRGGHWTRSLGQPVEAGVMGGRVWKVQCCRVSVPAWRLRVLYCEV